jgi:hypothetical protein
VFTGNPVLVETTFGQVGHTALLCPIERGGVVGYWRDNDSRTRPWLSTGSPPPQPWQREYAGQSSDARWAVYEGVSAIQSSYGVIEVIARRGDRLVHQIRSGTTSATATWQPATAFTP